MKVPPGTKIIAPVSLSRACADDTADGALMPGTCARRLRTRSAPPPSTTTPPATPASKATRAALDRRGAGKGAAAGTDGSVAPTASGAVVDAWLAKFCGAAKSWDALRVAARGDRAAPLPMVGETGGKRCATGT